MTIQPPYFILILFILACISTAMMMLKVNFFDFFRRILHPVEVHIHNYYLYYIGLLPTILIFLLYVLAVTDKGVFYIAKQLIPSVFIIYMQLIGYLSLVFPPAIALVTAVHLAIMMYTIETIKKYSLHFLVNIILVILGQVIMMGSIYGVMYFTVITNGTGILVLPILCAPIGVIATIRHFKKHNEKTIQNSTKT